MTMVVLVVVLGAVAPFVWLPGDDAADRWAASHGLALDDRTRPMVGGHLRLSHGLRRLGVVAGFTLPWLAGRALGRTGGGDLDFAWVFLGYLGGALYAELALVRGRPDPRRAASLVRRELRDYVSPAGSSCSAAWASP